MGTTVCLTFDFDAVSLWINTFKLTSPTPVSRGEYGAAIAIPRILRLLEQRGVPATFFVPGQTAEIYPQAVKAIYNQGHEIAAHGYLHESPVGLSREQESQLLERAERALEATVKARPVGYRSPAWDLSPHTIELLSERRYIYDSSMMSDDFMPFRARAGDKVGSDGAITWGKETNVFEFPVAWELDDFPYFAFVPRPMNIGLRNPRDVQEIWQAEFDYCHSEIENGVFTLTMHPQVIGRGPRLKMLDTLIKHMQQKAGVLFTTMVAASISLAP